MKPTICKQIGCAGRCCKHYKSTDKWPYFDCMKDEDDENEKDKGENDE